MFPIDILSSFTRRGSRRTRLTSGMQPSMLRSRRWANPQHTIAAVSLEALEARIVLATPVGNTIYSAQTVVMMPGMPWSFSGSIGDETITTMPGMPSPNPVSDVDLFQIQLSTGQTLIVDVDAQEMPSGTPLSSLDGYLRLFDTNGVELLQNDNTLGADPFLSFTASASGTYFIGLSGAPNTTYDPHSDATLVTSSTGDYELKLALGNSSGSGGTGSGGSGTSGTGGTWPGGYSPGTGGGSTGGTTGGTTGGSSGGTSGGYPGSGGTTGGGTTGGSGASQNANGSYTLHPGETLSIPGMVAVTNSSPDPDGLTGPIGDVEVWPTSTSATVKPVAGSNFSVLVGGDGIWDSPRNIGSLTFTTQGGMGVSPIDGNLELRATGGIGDIEGISVLAVAGGGIGKVIAYGGIVTLSTPYTIDNVLCYGSAGLISAAVGQDLTIMGEARWINGRYEDITVDGNLYHFDCTGGETLTVKQNVGQLAFFNDRVNVITVDGSITNMNFMNCDMTPQITVKSSIGKIAYDGVSQWLPTTSDYFGIHVDRSMTAGSTLTADVNLRDSVQGLTNLFCLMCGLIGEVRCEHS